jgi:collagenase-like PrtC family protease
MRISLGPLHYYWPRQQVLDFYADVAEAPVDAVHLGEVVCSRRHELRLDDWIEVADTLARHGKQCVLSTLTLIESESDLKALRRLVDNGRHLVEANDMGAVQLLSARRVPFVAGPTLNVFNDSTLALLAGAGAMRWVMPPELGRDALAAIQARRPAGMQTEVFAWGRLPLAYSSRCFTARHYNLQKDSCAFRCIEHAEGIALKTREGEEFLNLNGIQTQSSRIYSLLRQLPELRRLGVDMLRVSPQSEGTLGVVAALRKAIDGASPSIDDTDTCNGFWFGKPGLERVEEPIS